MIEYLFCAPWWEGQCTAFSQIEIKHLPSDAKGGKTEFGPNWMSPVKDHLLA